MNCPLLPFISPRGGSYAVTLSYSTINWFCASYRAIPLHEHARGPECCSTKPQAQFEHELFFQRKFREFQNKVTVRLNQDDIEDDWLGTELYMIAGTAVEITDSDIKTMDMRPKSHSHVGIMYCWGDCCYSTCLTTDGRALPCNCAWLLT